MLLYARYSEDFNLYNLGIESTNPAYIINLLNDVPPAHTIPTKNITKNLSSHWQYIIINIFLILGNSIIFIFIMLYMYQYMYNTTYFALSFRLIVVYFLIFFCVQLKNILYINDINIGEKEYYSYLLLMYQLVSNIPTEVYKKKYIKINMYYKSIGPYLYKYINKLQHLNQNNVIFNIIQIIIVLYVILLIYDIIYLFYCLFVPKFNYPFHNFTYSIGNNQYICVLEDENIQDNIDNLILKYKECKTESDQNIFNQAFMAANQKYAILLKKLHNKILNFAIILKLSFIGLNEELQNLDKVANNINNLFTFRLYKYDLLFISIIFILFILLLMIIYYYQYNTTYDKNSDIKFSAIAEEIFHNYNIYVLYSLQQYNKSHHMEISKEIEKDANLNIYYKLIIYSITIGIILSIILLIINRYNIIIILSVAVHHITFLFDDNVFILILVALFVSFMVTLKIYIINFFKDIINIFVLSCENAKNGLFIDHVFLYLYKLSVTSELTYGYKKFNGNIYFKNITFNTNDMNVPALTFNIKKNTITVIYHAPNINLYEYFNEIKNINHNIYIDNNDSILHISLSELSYQDITKMFIFNSEFPTIITRSLEDNIWLLNNNMTLYNIQLLHQMIPLDKVYNSINSYVNNNIFNVFNTSGGEKQRISIARTMASVLMSDTYTCVIFNNSFSGIDHKTSLYILNQLYLYKQSKEFGAIIISNQLQHMEYADVIMYIDDQGKVKIYDNKEQAYKDLKSIMNTH